MAAIPSASPNPDQEEASFPSSQTRQFFHEHFDGRNIEELGDLLHFVEELDRVRQIWPHWGTKRRLRLKSPQLNVKARGRRAQGDG